MVCMLSLHTSQVANQTRAYPGNLTMKLNLIYQNGPIIC